MKFQFWNREYTFDDSNMSMRGIKVRSIGIEHARFNIGFTNLVYNLCRFAILS